MQGRTSQPAEQARQPAAPWLSVGGPTVLAMTEQRRPSHLRVVRSARAAEVVEDSTRAAYWAKVQQLRDERSRLRAG